MDQSAEQARLIQAIRERDAAIAQLLPEADRLREEQDIAYHKAKRRADELEARLLSSHLTAVGAPSGHHRMSELPQGPPAQQLCAESPYHAWFDYQASIGAFAEEPEQIQAPKPVVDPTIPPGGRVVAYRRLALPAADFPSEPPPPRPKVGPPVLLQSWQSLMLPSPLHPPQSEQPAYAQHVYPIDRPNMDMAKINFLGLRQPYQECNWTGYDEWRDSRSFPPTREPMYPEPDPVMDTKGNTYITEVWRTDDYMPPHVARPLPQVQRIVQSMCHHVFPA